MNLIEVADTFCVKICVKLIEKGNSIQPLHDFEQYERNGLLFENILK